MDMQDLTRPEERLWYAQQERLLQYIESNEPTLRTAGLQLFLEQHAQLHSMDGAKSFADNVLAGLSDEDWRQKPQDKNSIAWLIWHNARIEDATFNLLILGKPQVLDERLARGSVGNKVHQGMAALSTRQPPRLHAFPRDPTNTRVTFQQLALTHQKSERLPFHMQLSILITVTIFYAQVKRDNNHAKDGILCGHRPGCSGCTT